MNSYNQLHFQPAFFSDQFKMVYASLGLKKKHTHQKNKAHKPIYTEKFPYKHMKLK